MPELTVLDDFNGDQEILDDNKILFNNILRNKRKDDRKKLNSVKEGIFERYELYLSQKNNLSAITPITDYTEYEGIMRNAYNNSLAFKEKRKQLFSKLPDGKKSTCPYCLVSESNTLDHYFPETYFSEFIVFIPNLIPCCYKCNKNKSKVIRKTIHFYFDAIPQEQYLLIDICFDDPYTPSIEISLKDNTPELIKNHYESLKLINRYKDRCSDELAVKSKSLLKSLKKEHYESAIDVLNDDVETLEEIYGQNYWKACLYKSIVNRQEEFKTFLNSL